MRLSTATLDRLSPDVETFAYDRAAQAAGIVHFGIGAFHRAHQAWYTDRAMDGGDRDWAITGVSLRSAGVAEQMNPQDGLYTLTERSAAGSRTRLIGAVRKVLVASQDPEAVITALAAPETRIASFTITEKGYCRAPDGSLDPAQAGSGSVYRFLADGLARRRAAGLPGITLLSCDNLANNGKVLERLVADYCRRNDPALGAWIAEHCTFPSTMVDRIVPATTETDRADARQAAGLDDDAAVVTEPFSQWVIEDRFAGPRPRWDAVGAQIVADVAPYETAKLRLLNGAHSALAYLGLERGHTYVHEAIGDPGLRPVIEQIMQEGAASFAAAPGQDLEAYTADLLQRFANPQLHHRLAQIAMDGSQKIPQRWLETLAFHAAQGRQCPGILTALAAWLRHVRGDRFTVNDPQAQRLSQAWDNRELGGAAEALFGPAGLLGGVWTPRPQDLAMMSS